MVIYSHNVAMSGLYSETFDDITFVIFLHFATKQNVQ